MNLETYEKTGRLEYARLAETVSAVLSAAVRADAALRLQHVQHRAKHVGSLRTKLGELANAAAIEIHVKDLAGCRLVFYTNSDVSRFEMGGYLRDNFDIDFDRTKFHHPMSGSDGADNLFISLNYVVKLKASRTCLPEYSGLEGLWCEVQIQTALNHAWSEMEHDMIYKRPELIGFGAGAMDAIEKRMATIMRKHLLPAGYEFQKVAYDFERLSAGKELFDRGALEALEECADNNARFDLLERFVTYVLPHYDDLAGVYAEIRASIVAAVKLARETPVRAIETPFGELPGHTAEQIARIAADILEKLRYVDSEATFDDICELFAGAQSSDERKRWLLAVEHLAENQIAVWEQVGPLVQDLLVTRVAGWSAERRSALQPVVLRVLKAALSAQVSGMTSTYDAFTIRQGAVAASDTLRSLRATAIQTLQHMLNGAIDDSDRREIIQALETATTTPYQANYSDDTLAIILDDTRNIVQYYTGQTESLSYELRQEIEHRLLWLHQRNRDMPPETAAHPSVAPAREALTEAISQLRAKLNADPDFVTYKTLVGYQSVFPHAWDAHSLDFNADEVYRQARIAEFVANVNDNNADEWLEVLRRCAKTDSRDLATFPAFGSFLQSLARERPRIVLGYLPLLNAPLENFLPAMMAGLAESSEASRLDELLRDWIAAGKFVAQVIRYLHFAEPFAPELLERAFEAAVKTANDDAVIDAVAAVARRHADAAGAGDSLIESVLMPGITYLARKDDARWVRAIWLMGRDGTLVSQLRPEQLDVFLDCMVKVRRIEFESETVLAAIARVSPEKVIEFFGMRLRVEVGEGDERYEAVPYELHDLPKVLANASGFFVAQARAWFFEDGELFSFRGGRLLAAAFPQFSKDLEDVLRELILKGDQTDLEFVVKFLRAYRGQSFLQNICKDLVSALSADSPLLGQVEIILTQTGVVSGEFGFVTAYQRKRDEIAGWEADDRPAVRAFAARFLRGLDRQIAAEQRRAEESLELRKLEYPDTNPENS